MGGSPVPASHTRTICSCWSTRTRLLQLEATSTLSYYACYFTIYSTFHYRQVLQLVGKKALWLPGSLPDHSHPHVSLTPPVWHCGKSSFSSQDTTLPHWWPTVEEARRTWTRRREFSLINRLSWTIFLGRELKNSLRLLCVWLPCAGSVIRPAVVFELAPMFIPRSVVCVRQHSLAGS